VGSFWEIFQRANRPCLELLAFAKFAREFCGRSAFQSCLAPHRAYRAAMLTIPLGIKARLDADGEGIGIP